MKKLLTIAMLCFLATTVMGQATSLRVDNTTGCIAYYRVWVRSSPCPFMGAMSSALIALPPGSTVYPNSAALGLPPNMFFIAAYTYNQPPGCTTYPLTTWMIGDPCTTYPPVVPMYSTTSCALCRQFNARWVPATTSGGQAQLIFL
jgi:hypothetical protein